MQVGEEDEEEEEAAGVGGDDEPGLKMIPKWKAIRITEMMPDASIEELIDQVLRREAEEMAAVIVAAAQKAAQEQLEEEQRLAEEECARAAALAAEEEEEEEDEEEDEEEEAGSYVAGNSMLRLKQVRVYKIKRSENIFQNHGLHTFSACQSVADLWV